MSRRPTVARHFCFWTSPSGRAELRQGIELRYGDSDHDDHHDDDYGGDDDDDDGNGDTVLYDEPETSCLGSVLFSLLRAKQKQSGRFCLSEAPKGRARARPLLLTYDAYRGNVGERTTATGPLP